MMVMIGSEICLLAEAISGLPHTPPPSLYQASEITKLLVVRFEYSTLFTL